LARRSRLPSTVSNIQLVFQGSDSCWNIDDLYVDPDSR
jgi:hypothetical protein